MTSYLPNALNPERIKTSINPKTNRVSRCGIITTTNVCFASNMTRMPGQEVRDAHVGVVPSVVEVESRVPGQIKVENSLATNCLITTLIMTRIRAQLQASAQLRKTGPVTGSFNRVHKLLSSRHCVNHGSAPQPGCGCRRPLSFNLGIDVLRVSLTVRKYVPAP